MNDCTEAEMKTRGSGVLAREFATYVRPAMRAPSAANREKSTHHRCKIYAKKFQKGTEMIGAGMPTKAPIIGPPILWVSMDMRPL